MEDTGESTALPVSPCLSVPSVRGLGYPLIDPIVGLVMTGLILQLLWQSGGEIFTRMLDGVDPRLVNQARQAGRQTYGVKDVTEVHLRWLGHRLRAELNIAVDPRLSVAEAHHVAIAVENDFLRTLPSLSHATIHVDPVNE
ncbi:MAG: hypothetical protein C5B57_08700 [Blastocatellia bacterium]|nr:MAG: hypothetical protein C5B57_08700 [Blastocatellia bacterium]